MLYIPENIGSMDPEVLIPKEGILVPWDNKTVSF